MKLHTCSIAVKQASVRAQSETECRLLHLLEKTDARVLCCEANDVYTCPCAQSFMSSVPHATLVAMACVGIY